MKKIKEIMAFLFAGSIILAACSQSLDDSKVPAATKTSFAKDFPGASAKWDKEN